MRPLRLVEGEKRSMGLNLLFGEWNICCFKFVSVYYSLKLFKCILIQGVSQYPNFLEYPDRERIIGNLRKILELGSIEVFHFQ